MGYMDLIAILQSLPQDRQAEVFDFVEFIAVKSGVVIENPLLLKRGWMRNLAN